MREREYNMDYLRIFACFMVIFLHVAAQNWSSVEVTGKQWHVFNLYNSAVRSSVPLFLMLSGKLLLSHGDDFSMKKFFSKNIKKLFIVYLVWAFLYAVDTVGIAEILKGNYRNLIACVVGSKFHLWYLSTLPFASVIYGAYKISRRTLCSLCLYPVFNLGCGKRIPDAAVS